MSDGVEAKQPALVRLARYLLVAGVAAFAVAPLRVNDLFWNVMAGRWFLEHRALPTEDPFTTGAPGKHWVCHEWLSQIALALIDRAAGLAGLRVVRVALLLAAIGLAQALLARRTRRPILVVLGLCALWLLWQPHATLRPHLFGWLFMLGFTWIASAPPPFSKPRLAAIFALTVAWMNFHSSGLVAIALLGAYLVGRAIEGKIARAPQRPALVGLGAALAVVTLATLAQPEGYHLYAYPALTRETGRGIIAEWLPLLAADTFEDMPRWPLTFLAVTLGFALALVSRVRRRAPPSRFPGALPSLLAIVMTADVRRMTFFMLLPVLFVIEELSEALDRSPPKLFARPDQAWVPQLGALAAALVAWAVLLPEWAFTGSHFLPGYAPEAALAFARDARLEGRMFNPFMWGGLVEYRLWPAQKAFIDGRMDLFGRKLVTDAFTIERASPEADAIYAEHAIDWSLVETQAFLEGAPLDPSRWALAYADATAIVLLRRGPRFEANVARACSLYASGAWPKELPTWRLERPRPQARIPSVLALCAR